MFCMVYISVGVLVCENVKEGVFFLFKVYISVKGCVGKVNEFINCVRFTFTLNCCLYVYM